MRTPAKRTGLDKRLLKLASSSKKESEILDRFVDYIYQVGTEFPFASEIEFANKVRELAESKEGKLENGTFQKLYRATKNVIIPYFSSGAELVKGKSILDGIAKTANDNLYQEKFTKEGDSLGKVFEPAIANVVISAVSKKLDIIGKFQQNQIAAQRLIGLEEQAASLMDEISELEEDELDRFIFNEIVEETDIVDKLFDKTRDSKIENVNFYNTDV